MLAAAYLQKILASTIAYASSSSRGILRQKKPKKINEKLFLPKDIAKR